MSISVMVTGIGGGGHGAQILKALRLAKTDYDIVGCDISPYSRGFKDVDHCYLVPPAGNPLYIDTIISICLKHGVKVLFHGSEPELKMLSRFRDRITEQGIFLPINTKAVIDLCMKKSSTMSFLKERGFACPETQVFSCPDDLKGWDLFPVIIKPSIGGGGSANTFIAQNKKELEMISSHLLGLGIARELIVQEYVGSMESEFTVGVLCDMEGKLINSIAVKRDLKTSLSCRLRVPNLTDRKELGPVLSVSTGISQGEVGPFPEVTVACEKVAVALGAKGAINIQCRVHKGNVYIFEINPRFSGTTSIRALAGYNEPDLLIRKHLLNEDIPPHFPYKTGVVARALQETFFSSEEIRNFCKKAKNG